MTSLFFHITSLTALHGTMAQVPSQSVPQGAGMIAGIFGLVWLAVVVLTIAGLWKLFTKAGKPGWASIVPIYNLIVLLEIVGKPIWWIILLLIPFVNFIAIIIILIALAKSFGKGIGYGLGCVFLGFIFIPMLGFSDAKYVGPQS